MTEMVAVSSEELARRVRRHAVQMVHDGRASHIGAILSTVDLLAVLYGRVMQFRPKEPNWSNRDRFVLSKGHAGVALYATLAEVGFFPVSVLNTYYRNGSDLSGHVSHKGVPGVEASTGSLGHGVAMACGMALAGKLDGKKFKTYALVGDGELNEGAVWETVMFAAHQKLKHFTMLVDRNGLQAMGACDDICCMEPLAKRFEDFGWLAIEVNGHDHGVIEKALREETERPKCIIARTVKGRGVSFMENRLEWHYRTPDDEALRLALEEIG